MGLTLAQFRTEVKRFGGYGTGDDAFITSALNDAERTIYGAERWEWLRDTETITTTPGTATYPLAADFRVHERLRPQSTSVTKPEWVDSHDFERRTGLWDGAPYEVGPPAIYTIRNRVLTFCPAPDTFVSYTHDFWRLPPLMTLDSDTTPIPTEHEMVLVYAALVRMAQRDKHLNMAQTWAASYDSVYRRMREAETFNQYTRPNRIPVPRRYGGSL